MPGAPESRSQRKNSRRRYKKRERARLRRIGADSTSGAAARFRCHKSQWCSGRYVITGCDVGGAPLQQQRGISRRVFWARDTVNRQRCVLKFVATPHAGRREMEIQQLVLAEHAPAVLDGFMEDGVFVIVMEAADSSETLADILAKHRARGSRMDDFEARAVAKRVAQARLAFGCSKHTHTHTHKTHTAPLESAPQHSVLAATLSFGCVVGSSLLRTMSSGGRPTISEPYLNHI